MNQVAIKQQLSRVTECGLQSDPLESSTTALDLVKQHVLIILPRTHRSTRIARCGGKAAFTHASSRQTRIDSPCLVGRPAPEGWGTAQPLPSEMRHPSESKATKKPPFGGGFLVSTLLIATMRAGVEDDEQECLTWHRPIFSGGDPPTIVGAAAFHSRVRDGIGVVPLRHGHQEKLLLSG